MMQILACRDRSDMGYVGFLIGSEAMTDALFLLDTDHDDVPVNSDELNAGWRLTLPSSVRRHAIQAMRLKDGDELQLSDGRGLRIHAVLRDAQQGIAEVLRFGKEPQPVTRLALVQALAKTGHDEQAIDMATQIGVDQVIPWQADRSIAKWKAGRTDKKWRQVLESATEQSRRSWTPQLDDCVTSKQVVAICKRACVHGDMVIVLHQDATKTWEQLETGIAKLSDTCLKDGRRGVHESRRRSVRAGKQHPTCVHRRSGRAVIARASIGTFRLIPAPLREIAGIAPFPAGVAW